MIALVAAATLSFTACNNTKADANTESATTDSTLVEAPAADSICTSACPLNQYAVIIGKMVALKDKVKAGDANATQELTGLAKEATDAAAVLSTDSVKATLTPEQVAKLDELQKQFAELAK